MKTAIVNTSFWDEEDFGKTHLGTKLVYNHLLTNPSRGLSPYMKINRLVMGARTGLDKEQVTLGLQQLVEIGWILEYKGYVMFLKNHVSPKKGRFTDDAIARELQEIPKDVIAYFEENIQVPYLCRTGTSPVHNNIYNNIYNTNISNKNSKEETKSQLELYKTQQQYKSAQLLSQLIEKNLQDVGKQPKSYTDAIIRNWSHDIEKLHRIDGYSWEAIDGIIKWCQQNEFWKVNIQSGSALRKQFPRLILQAKTQHDNLSSQVTVI